LVKMDPVLPPKPMSLQKVRLGRSQQAGWGTQAGKVRTRIPKGRGSKKGQLPSGTESTGAKRRGKGYWEKVIQNCRR